jgi:hypothetical protein
MGLGSRTLAQSLQAVCAGVCRAKMADESVLQAQLTYAACICLLSQDGSNAGHCALQHVLGFLKAGHNPSNSQLFPVLVQLAYNTCRGNSDNIVNSVLGRCSSEQQREVWRLVSRVAVDQGSCLHALEAAAKLSTGTHHEVEVWLDAFEWQKAAGCDSLTKAVPAAIQGLLSGSNSVSVAEFASNRSWNLADEELEVDCRDAIMQVRACLLQATVASSHDMALPYLVQAHRQAAAVLRTLISAAQQSQETCLSTVWPAAPEDWLGFRISRQVLKAMSAANGKLAQSLTLGLRAIEVWSWLQLLCSELRRVGNLAACLPLLWLQHILLELPGGSSGMADSVMRKVVTIERILIVRLNVPDDVDASTGEQGTYWHAWKLMYIQIPSVAMHTCNKV